ncbi:probable chlorophyll(ide) b reductase NYC1, chloroplastic [Rhododendron vialii]|uniref:probable chlorophyll(ide) b reductase NYC1, chloroplastic n=1 Tax=Rhododendron vialii TaxID=182163 RepID=UPI00265F2624|nr:probable chlorophyll(ide) b reductase NYC1, chloroplastic [Rhododendron vialii]
MAAVAKIHVSPPLHCHRSGQPPPVRLDVRRNLVMLETISAIARSRGRRRLCARSFRSEEGGGGGEVAEEEEESVRKGENNLMENNRVRSSKGSYTRLDFLKSAFLQSPLDDRFQDALDKLEERLFSIAMQIGRYIVTMASTGVILLIGFQLSGGDSQLNDLVWYSWLGGVIIGTMIGANMVLDDVSRAGPRNVVITGSTRGLGKALAREFLLSGDRVVVASRSPESVDMTIKELEEILKEGVVSEGGSSGNMAHAKVVGIACDVCKPDDVRKLANFAVSELGSIDIWINNAGTNKGFRPLLEFSDNDIQQIVSTNLVGSILCTREAMHVMKNQNKGGHIFNMDGAGSGGSSTPLTAVYGSTKCGLRQLQSSLFKECKKSKVGVHTASPGMVLTDLLLSGSTIQNKQMFNIICELPETVARTLVPRMRVVKGSGKAINYLTPPRILLALVTAWLRRGRWFDDKGRALYAAEADRLRNWAESRTRFSFTDAMEMYTENTWVSVFSLSVVCAFIILTSTGSGSTFPGT